MDNQDALTILRWAAGAPEDMTGLGGLDAPELLRLFAGHHLYARFVARVGQEHPRWAPRTLTIGAWQYLNHARRTLQRLAAAVREIGQALDADTAPPVILTRLSAHSPSWPWSCSSATVSRPTSAFGRTF